MDWKFRGRVQTSFRHIWCYLDSCQPSALVTISNMTGIVRLVEMVMAIEMVVVVVVMAIKSWKLRFVAKLF